MKKNLMILFCVWMVVSCETVANYRKTVNSWKGLPVAKLVASWGTPQEILEHSNLSSTRYVYVKEKTIRGGGYYVTIPIIQKKPTDNLTGIEKSDGNEHAPSDFHSEYITNYIRKYIAPYTNHYSCHTSFKVNKKTKLVVSVRFKGNDCSNPPQLGDVL